MLEKINRIKEKLPQKKVTVQELVDIGNRWEENHFKDLANRLKRSQIREIAYGVVTLISVIGLVFMATTSNHYIQIEEIDRATGYRAMKQLYKAGEFLPTSLQDDFLRADVRRFIECYEGYALSKRNDNLKCVTNMSSTRVARNYIKYVDEKNENGPAHIIGALGQMNVDIQDINPLSEDKFTVISHVIVTPNTPKTEKLPKKPDIPLKVTLTYKYTTIPTNSERRQRNPHGFMVQSYMQEFSQKREKL